jgi:hypothetical protein
VTAAELINVNRCTWDFYICKFWCQEWIWRERAGT